jgi:hypothetical protein
LNGYFRHSGVKPHVRAASPASPSGIPMGNSTIVTLSPTPTIINTNPIIATSTCEAIPSVRFAWSSFFIARISFDYVLGSWFSPFANSETDANEKRGGRETFRLKNG